MDPIARGALLGIANIHVIALGIAVKEHAGAAGFAAMSLIGSLPAVIAGLLIGAIADRTRRLPTSARLVAIIVPALLIVTAIGVVVGFDAYVTLAFVPTVVAALYLEQSSRESKPLPTAHARVGS